MVAAFPQAVNKLSAMLFCAYSINSVVLFWHFTPSNSRFNCQRTDVVIIFYFRRRELFLVKLLLFYQSLYPDKLMQNERLPFADNNDSGMRG